MFQLLSLSRPVLLLRCLLSSQSPHPISYHPIILLISTHQLMSPISHREGLQLRFVHRLLLQALLLLQKRLVHHQRARLVQLQTVVHQLEMELKHTERILVLHGCQVCIIPVAVVANDFGHAAPAVARLHWTCRHGVMSDQKAR